MPYTGEEYWAFRVAAEKRGINNDLAHYYMLCRNLPAVKAIKAARMIVATR